MLSVCGSNESCLKGFHLLKEKKRNLDRWWWIKYWSTVIYATDTEWWMDWPSLSSAIKAALLDATCQNPGGLTVHKQIVYIY